LHPLFLFFLFFTRVLSSQHSILINPIGIAHYSTDFFDTYWDKRCSVLQFFLMLQMSEWKENIKPSFSAPSPNTSITHCISARTLFSHTLFALPFSHAVYMFKGFFAKAYGEKKGEENSTKSKAP
jgi:hypothetical protein